LTETEAVALKRVLAFQLEKEMEDRKLSKLAFAPQMKTSRSSLDRLLDPDNPSVTLLTLEKAAAVLGLQLKVEFA
jgi:antitoxin HicB